MKFIDKFSTKLKRQQLVQSSPLHRKLELWDSLKGTFMMKLAAIQSVVRKWCCNYILLSKLYCFKNAEVIFCLKFWLTCCSSRLIFVSICFIFNKKQIRVTGVQKIRPPDRVRVNLQHIKSKGRSQNLQKWQPCIFFLHFKCK